MGNRYWMTGVQLGILMSNTDEKVRMKILNEIMNEQLIENMSVVTSYENKEEVQG